jgi:hypothetical protein
VWLRFIVWLRYLAEQQAKESVAASKENNKGAAQIHATLALDFDKWADTARNNLVKHNKLH